MYRGSQAPDLLVLDLHKTGAHLRNDRRVTGSDAKFTCNTRDDDARDLRVRVDALMGAIVVFVAFGKREREREGGGE